MAKAIPSPGVKQVPLSKIQFKVHPGFYAKPKTTKSSSPGTGGRLEC